MENFKKWYRDLDNQINHLIRRYKRKKFFLKAKMLLLFVLPVLIILIGVKAAKTWLRIKVRGIATASPSPKILPVHQETVPNEYVTPEPVGKPVSEDTAATSNKA